MKLIPLTDKNKIYIRNDDKIYDIRERVIIDFANSHKDYLNLRYNSEIPTDRYYFLITLPNEIIGLSNLS